MTYKDGDTRRVLSKPTSADALRKGLSILPPSSELSMYPVGRSTSTLEANPGLAEVIASFDNTGLDDFNDVNMASFSHGEYSDL